MMNKLKYILVLFTMLYASHTNSQEKQNDATWEETIEFLQKYSNQIKDAEMGSFEKKYFKNRKINIQSEGIPFGTAGNYLLDKHKDWGDRFSGSDDFYKRYYKLYEGNFPFKYLLKIEMYSNSIYLILSTEISYSYSVKTNYYNVGKVENDLLDRETNQLKLTYVDNEELLPRIEKAFKHLTYLAIEKRKLEREKSGEKF